MEEIKKYHEFMSIPDVKGLVESIRDLTNSCDNPEIAIHCMVMVGNFWLKAYNKYGKDSLPCKGMENFYQDMRLKAKQLGADISKYPKNLEELTK